jgi:hypothetical protein
MADYTNSELDRKFRYLEDLILQRAPANAGVAAGVTVIAGGTPPKVTGLTLTSRILKIVVSWNAVPISDLKRYEVQVSTADDFTDATTYFTRETQFSYEEGDQATVYYVRVRARNIGEQTGAYSGTLNATTGQVTAAYIEDDAVGSDAVADGAIQTVHLETEAITNLESAYTAGAFTFTGGVDTIQTVTITVEEAASLVIIHWGFSLQRVGGDESQELWVYRDTAESMSTLVNTNGTTKKHAAGVIIETPGAGTYTYTMKIDSNGNDDTASNRYLVVQEIKR